MDGAVTPRLRAAPSDRWSTAGDGRRIWEEKTVIRAARAAELSVLQEIERAALTMFVDWGRAEIGAYEPPTLEELRRHQQQGCAWLAVSAHDQPVAYLLADIVDGNAHIEQVSVHPHDARRGLGKALIEHAVAWARQRGLGAVTLTTFTDVPWNAPYYQRLGFRRLSDEELTPGLRAIRAREAAIGLDRWPRCCMRRDL
jgi:GNAT superfamily N-acetyltransferase